MGRRIYKKIFAAIFTILILSFLLFVISHLAPGDPLYSLVGDGASQMSQFQRKKIMTNLGLDKPLLIQYFLWIKEGICGNLGYSYKYGIEVSTILKESLPNTIILMGFSYFWIILISLLLGGLMAFNEGSFIDIIIRRIGSLFYSIPGFWMGLALIWIFSVTLGLLPSSGVSTIGMEDSFFDKLEHLILPSATVVICHIGYYSNYIRDKMIEEMSSEYVLYAKAKGLSTCYIMTRHILKNCMASLITLSVLSVNHLMTGSYVAELIFSYPGLGKIIFESAKFHDYPLLMGAVVVTGIVVVIVGIIGDAGISMIDPRRRGVES